MFLFCKDAATYWVFIYIAGDIHDIERVCRNFCDRGLCVTVEPLNFIFTRGSESGARIGLINYPRFPEEKEIIWKIAEDLAHDLATTAVQDSVLIMDAEKTLWKTRRPQDSDRVK